MASPVFQRAPSVLSSTTIRRRLPLVGAFCMLSLGFSNICPTLTSSLQNGAPNSIRMEGNSDTIPSTVVYVTVSNREVGIESVYQWQGEELLIIKTRQSLVEAVTEHVKANHE
ncbi:hypothetical protein Peur_050564 [Populus x canadensis]